jgi:hypothetical protein
MTLPADLVLPRLDRTHELSSSKHARRWLASCPGPNHKNGDAHPSLIVSETHEGDVLFYCHVSCDWRDICDALGVAPRDLFVRRTTDRTLANEIPKISARDALLLISFESMVVLITSDRLMSGTLTAEERARAVLARDRISRAMELAGVRPERARSAA